MNADELLLVLAGVAALGFLLQGLALWWISRSARELSRKIQTQTDSLEKDVRELLQRLSKLAEGLQPLTGLSHQLEHNARLVSQLVQARSRDVDELVEELRQLTREQASKVDYVVTDTVQKFHQTTEILQKDLVRPALEVASFLKGLRSGFQYLFAGKQPDRKKEPEEEMFI